MTAETISPSQLENLIRFNEDLGWLLKGIARANNGEVVVTIDKSDLRRLQISRAEGQDTFRVVLKDK